MFVRIRKNKGTKRCSVVICHSVRMGNKVRQLTVKTLGHSDEPVVLTGWVKEANHWIEEHADEWFKQLFPVQRQKIMGRQISLYNVKEASRINVGITDIFGKLYDELGFKELLSPTHQKTLR